LVVGFFFATMFNRFNSVLVDAKSYIFDKTMPCGHDMFTQTRIRSVRALALDGSFVSECCGRIKMIRSNHLQAIFLKIISKGVDKAQSIFTRSTRYIHGKNPLKL
jgi:hypothetical protein